MESEAEAIFSAARPAGQPLVDDWDCHKDLIQKFEGSCAPLGQYGMKHGRAFANEPINKLYDAIRQLSEVDRGVILLYLEEKSYQEIPDHRDLRQQHRRAHQTNQRSIEETILKWKKRLKQYGKRVS